jgi:hypothetical protein
MEERLSAPPDATAAPDATTPTWRPSESARPAQPRRGQATAAKIDGALDGLRAAGELLPSLRPIDLYRRIRAWLEAAGYRGRELPSKWTVGRHLDGKRQMRRQP